MKEVKKTLANQWYNGQEDITIKAHEYVLLKIAVEQAMQNLVTASFPEVVAFMDPETGAYVESPTEEQLADKSVVSAVSPERTFSAENRKISYDGKVTQELLSARELVVLIHQRNVEAGLTTDVEILQKEFEEAKAAVKVNE